MHPFLAALKAELAKPDYAGLTDAQAAAKLNQPSGTKPRPITVEGLMGAFSDASLAKLYANPLLATFRDDVRAQDRPAVANWIGLAVKSGDIAPTEYAAALAQLQATDQGPSKAVQILTVPATANDVASARSL